MAHVIEFGFLEVMSSSVYQLWVMLWVSILCFVLFFSWETYHWNVYMCACMCMFVMPHRHAALSAGSGATAGSSEGERRRRALWRETEPAQIRPAKPSVPPDPCPPEISPASYWTGTQATLLSVMFNIKLDYQKASEICTYNSQKFHQEQFKVSFKLLT